MSVFTRIIAQADVAAATILATPTPTIGEAAFDATVTEAVIVPNAAVTAADTHYRTLTLTNEGSDGLGTTVVATLLLNAAGGDWVQGDEKAMTLSATAADLVVAAGDVLTIRETVTGNGLAHGGYEATVKGTRDIN